MTAHQQKAVREYITLRQEGHRRADLYVADRYDMNPNSLRRLASEYRHAQARPNGAPKRDTKELPRLRAPLVFPPLSAHARVDEYPRFTEDTTIIAGDVHATTHDKRLFERMVKFGKRENVRNLYLVGDVWNGEADSDFDPHGDEARRALEFEVVADLLHYALSVFDHIYMTPGNHLRKRFLRTVKADMTMEQVVRLVTHESDDQRVTLFRHDILEIVSGGERWTCTHQYQYSRNKLIVAAQLAQKYQTHIITFHQHHTASGRDAYNRYTVIDCGGLHDHTRMEYIHLVPSTRPVPNAGFVYLEHGTAHLMTPYRTMTRWARWGFEEAA